MKPILFNTEMVKAILESRKKQTRRIIPVNPTYWTSPTLLEPDCAVKFNYAAGGCQNHSSIPHFENSKYTINDILYVRETWTLGEKEIIRPENVWYIRNDLGNDVFYKADIDDNFYDPDNICKWKPSIHMPKRYARVFLKVTNVRIERVQDISLTNMLEEGINHLKNYSVGGVVKPYTQIKREFINLWNSTIKDGYKWEDNPYVFVYEFEKIEKKRLGKV